MSSVLSNDMPRVSVIIPIYKGGALAKTAYDLVSEAMKEAGGIEVLFGNDGSPDDSLERLEILARKHENVRVFTHGNRGLGYTLTDLIGRARGGIVVYVDVDLSFDPGALPGLVAAVADCDIVTASRYVGAVDCLLPVSRRFWSRLYWLAARAVFGVVVRDVGSGMVVFKRERVAALGVEAEGFDWHLELYDKARRRGYVVKELAVSYRHWDGGSFRPWKHLPALLNRFIRYAIIARK